ncbi:MAG: rRNA maturation RNase YbeY [Pseudomonadota bacterium]
MTQALEALPHGGLPDEDDLLAGPPSLRANIRIEDPAWNAVDQVALADMVLTAVSAHHIAPRHAATCDILFASDEAVAHLNGAFRGKSGPTNVLAFPSGENPGDAQEAVELGGIALAFGVMQAEARGRGIPRAHHTAHLLLHGVLHLLGLEHEREEDRLAMERTEIDILQGLGIPDPYEGS